MNISKEHFLQQDRHTFDQDRTKGWRSLVESELIDSLLDTEKVKSVAELILLYYENNKDVADVNQSSLLLFHAAQLYGFAGDIEESTKILDEIYKTNPSCVGSEYLQATIAFLSNDGEKLTEIFSNMDKDTINYDTVERLYNGYQSGKDYFESYHS